MGGRSTPEKQIEELLEILKKILIQKRAYILKKDEKNAHVFEERARRYYQELKQMQKDPSDFPHPTFFVHAYKLYSFERDVVITKEIFPEEFRPLFALQASGYHHNPAQVESFLNYQQQVSFQNDAENFSFFLQGLLHEEADIFLYTSVISAIEEWLQKTEADIPLSEYDPVKDKANQQAGSGKALHIEESIISTLFKKLKPFFSAEDQAKLLPLLQGEPLIEKLHFLSQQNTLAFIFQVLWEYNFIIESKANVKRWLEEHFTYRDAKTKEQKDLNQGVVYQILCNHPDRQVQKDSRIDLSDIVSKK